MTTATARFGEDNDPFAALSRDMNRLLDDFTRGFGVSVPTGFGASGTWPHVEVIETEKEVKVVAELPGMEQNDIDLSLHDGMLTLKGEKKSESNGAHYSERWHGKFQRSLQVGPDLDPERVGASFRNGVLRPSALSEKQPQRFRALAQRLLRLAEGASRNATAVASPPHTMSQTMQLRHDEGA